MVKSFIATLFSTAALRFVLLLLLLPASPPPAPLSSEKEV